MADKLNTGKSMSINQKHRLWYCDVVQGKYKHTQIMMAEEAGIGVLHVFRNRNENWSTPLE